MGFEILKVTGVNGASVALRCYILGDKQPFRCNLLIAFDGNLTC
jgi:hypothetical protein